jgi:ApaG protein
VFAEITNDIQVSVISEFHTIEKVTSLDQYIFHYHIQIENQGNFTVQLLSRKWIIIDAHGTQRIVEGMGVVGEQPILEPGDSHRYSSSCLLPSPFGKMSGSYTFERRIDGEQFNVRIPEFRLEVPYLLS